MFHEANLRSRRCPAPRAGAFSIPLIATAGLLLGAVPTATLASACESPTCYTVEGLRVLGSFQSDGLVFSDFHITDMPADWEFHVLPSTSAPTGLYWSGGFVVTGPDRTSLRYHIPPNGYSGSMISYRVAVPDAPSGIATILDAAHFGLIGMSFGSIVPKGFAAAEESILSPDGPVLTFVDYPSLATHGPSVSDEMALGPFLRANVVVRTDIALHVDASEAAAWDVEINSLLQTFSAKTVPEPASGLLAVLGLAGMGAVGRRVRRPD